MSEMADPRRTGILDQDPRSAPESGSAECESPHALAAKLRESESRYAQLFENSPVAFLEVDRRGVIVRINNAASNLLRCPSEVLRGRHVWNFFAPGDQEGFRSALMDRISAGIAATSVELLFLLDDGSRVTLELHETLIRNDRGVVIGACHVLLDLTERNLASVAVRQVQRYATELHAKNEQLANALEAARNATTAKSRFLAGMSHELRTPLNSIIGFSQLLHDGVMGELTFDQKDCLNDVLTSSKHLLQLINEILDLSKVEAGKMEFRPVVSNIAALVSEVLDGVRPLAESKNLNLTRDVPADLQAVIDPVRFKQVLYNYLSNAVKFTPGGGRVSLRITLEDAGSRFRVEVEDSGVGMAPDELVRLFQEFQQVSSARMADQGTGLGLALTKRLVEAQGGSVSVRSTKGVGSVFTATFLRVGREKHGATQ